MRPLALLPFALVLLACGVVPVPEQKFADFSFVLVNGMAPRDVAYIGENQLSVVKVPDLPYQQVSGEAVLTYRGTAPSLRLELFVSATRPDCPLVQLPAEFIGYTGALKCVGPAGGTTFTEVTLYPNQAVPIQIASPVLDEALRRRTLYLGLRLLDGVQGYNDRVDVTTIRMRGKL